MIARRQWIVIVILALTAAGVWRSSLARRTGAQKKLYAKTVPATLGDWIGRDVPVAESITNVLRTTDVLERQYRSGDGRTAVFSVVFAMDDRTAVHAPEECLVGGGNQIVHRATARYAVRRPKGRVGPDPRTGELPVHLELGETIDLEVVELGLDGPRGPSVVHFFYKSGDWVTSNYVWHELQMLWSNIRRGTSTNALVKVTVPIAGPVTPRALLDARAQCREVMTLLFPYVMAALP